MSPPTGNGQTEKAFQEAVLELAALCGWLSYHTHDSRRSTAGFPDLVLVRGTTIVFAELKSEKGRTSAEQKDWLAVLQGVESKAETQAQMIDNEWGYEDGRPTTPLVRVRCWRPSNWPEIEAVLTAKRDQTAQTDDAREQR